MMVTVPRRMTIRIYFSDSPTPIDIEGVCHLGTEGELLRVVTQGANNSGSLTQWWPLKHVFNIRMLERSDQKQIKYSKPKLVPST